MGARERLTDLSMKGMSGAHRVIVAATGGRLGRQIGGMPALELHTTGRRSGKRRTVMLTAPIRERDRIVLVASKGGDDRHPEWYLNLVDDPSVEVTVDGATTRMRARTATPAEKIELWPAIVDVYPGYAGYQRRTAREIPVVICEPATT